MDFKTVDNRYRPVPFWSWNEKLEPEESRRQIRLMKDAGIGGFFMHARGGLQTEYMGEEWFQNVEACIDEAEKDGMLAWAYDENGWPSGFGGGAVNGKGIRYQQKYLRVRKLAAGEEAPEAENVICRFEDYYFYYDVNPFYVDTLDGAVIADFIHEIYEPYAERFGTRFEGFFTDEPQISRAGFPWSLILPAEYEKAYGEPIYSHLIELFEQRGDWKRTRMNYWMLVTRLFSENFMKQIYDWCHAHGLKLTGHLVLEESLECQLTANGACMPHYEYMDIPGMDWLGRPIFSCLTPYQVASAAAQTGHRQVLSETFACCGHNMGHDEMKRNYEWMMVRGINLMCQHLEGYSLRGLRKRDYPPAMYSQQPWWPDYKAFNDAMSRTGMLLSEGEIRVRTLVLHPQTSAWICYDAGKNEGLQYYNDAFPQLLQKLERKHIEFHLGDETLLARHARVEGNALVVGAMRYTQIVLPPHLAFLDSTEALLREFRANGGRIVTEEELPEEPVIDNPEITYASRYFGGEKPFTFRYFVNSTDREQPAKIQSRGVVLDAVTGETLPFTGNYTFPPYGSLLLIDDGTPNAESPVSREAKVLTPEGTWELTDATENALTLDRCTYWLDGELIEKDGFVLNVLFRALELKKQVEVRCEYTVLAEYVPEKLYLACETPELFDISVNGKALVQKDCGFFRDRSFRKLDISGLMAPGENKIETRMLFKQSEKVYENIEKAKVFETELNILNYDMEIEALYLVGQFGVRADGPRTEREHNAFFCTGPFVLTAPVEKISLSHLEEQGFLFFAGELTAKKELVLEEDDTSYVLRFAKEGVNAVRIRVNGQKVGTVLWAPYEADLTPYLHTGRNTVELTLVNNLRNLLGPHHHPDGELQLLGPFQFYDYPCIWNSFGKIGSQYVPEYCFVHTGLR